jgi:hypothetical protein
VQLEAVWSLRLYAGSEGSALIFCTAPHSSTLAVRSWRTLVEVPFVARPRTAATELVRIVLAKFAAPFDLSSPELQSNER